MFPKSKNIWGLPIWGDRQCLFRVLYGAPLVHGDKTWNFWGLGLQCMVPIKFFEVSIQPIFWKICQIAITRHVHVVSRLDKKLNMNMVNRSLILRNFALWRIKWKRNVLTLKAFNWYIWLPCHVSYKHSLFGFIATRFIHCPWHLIFSHSSKTKRSFVKQIGSLSSLFSPLKSSIANMALWELKYWV